MIREEILFCCNRLLLVPASINWIRHRANAQSQDALCDSFSPRISSISFFQIQYLL